MAKFCEFCNTKLEDGMVCNCSGAAAQRPTAPPPPPPSVQRQTVPPPPPPPVVTQRQAAPPPPSPPLRPGAPYQPPHSGAPYQSPPPHPGTSYQPPPPHPGTPYQPTMPPVAPYQPPPIVTTESGACLHCGFQMPAGTSFCGKCGKQAGTAPPPKPRVFCQGCGRELDDGLRFCQYCGHKAPGASFSFPAGNASATLDTAKNFVSGLNISLQRLVIMAVSIIGIICVLFTPLMTASAMGQTLTVKWFDDAVGWIVLACFAAPVILSLLGDRTSPIRKLKFACIPLGAVNALIAIIRINAFKDEMSAYGAMVSSIAKIGFGVYLIVIMSAALCAIPFIKPLEK